MNLRKFKILLILPVFLVLGNMILGVYRLVKSEIYTFKLSSKEFHTFSLSITEANVDWNNYDLMQIEAKRIGRGEQGKSEFLTNITERNLDDQLFKYFGVSALVSQKISLNRSIPDLRSKECINKLYPKHLPQVSIIMILSNEILSVLLRTLHSLYNRTPTKLIKELIIIHDNSSLAYLHTPIDEYITMNFVKLKFKILSLQTNNAKSFGGREASADILVFINSHIEFGHNWLPPLIDPILSDESAITIPNIDEIDNKNFYYSASNPHRGVFNWRLEYKKIPKSFTKDTVTTPYPSPIMREPIFAISKNYFEILGLNSEHYGSIESNIENMEMSLRIWLCGGKILKVQCSRIGHIFKSNFSENRNEYLNKKIFCELWLDEYKQSVYMRDPDSYSNVNEGDLLTRFKFRKKCKSFKYFMEEVAPDMILEYPPIVANIASGAINLYKTAYCVILENSQIQLDFCDNNNDTKQFEMTWFLDIRFDFDACWTAPVLTVKKCNTESKEQRFRYYKDTLEIKSLDSMQCLEGDVDTMTVSLESCNSTNIYQKWEWSSVKD